jgi:DNA helicase-2/ATP-dependent DNA helicase PcrA
VLSQKRSNNGAGIAPPSPTSSPGEKGVVRLFIVPNNTADKQKTEASVCVKMTEATGDESWQKPENIKTLILEHHMAAKRLGFIELYKHLHGVDYFQTGLRDGSLPIVRFFSETIYPLVSAVSAGNQFAAATVVRNGSPLLTKEAFRKSGADQLKQVRAAKEAVDCLIALFADGKQPTFLDVLSRSRVTEFVGELQRTGLVTIERRGQGKTNIYTVHFQVKQAVDKTPRSRRADI